MFVSSGDWEKVWKLKKTFHRWPLTSRKSKNLLMFLQRALRNFEPTEFTVKCIGIWRVAWHGENYSTACKSNADCVRFIFFLGYVNHNTRVNIFSAHTICLTVFTFAGGRSSLWVAITVLSQYKNKNNLPEGISWIIITHAFKISVTRTPIRWLPGHLSRLIKESRTKREER